MREPRLMTDTELIRAMEFLNYFNVKYDDKTIWVHSGDSSCIMNPNTEWKEFLGASIASIAEAVARKTNREFIRINDKYGDDDYDDEDEEDENDDD